MNSVWLLIPLALVILAGALWAFFWAVDSGQFDDLESHGADALERGSADDSSETGPHANASTATQARYFNCCG